MGDMLCSDLYLYEKHNIQSLRNMIYRAFNLGFREVRLIAMNEEVIDLIRKCLNHFFSKSKLYTSMFVTRRDCAEIEAVIKRKVKVS